jgi:hypothetical protein
MSVIDWGNAQETILVWRVYNSWTPPQSIQNWNFIHHLLHNSRDLPVSLIIDVRQCFVPLNFLLMLRSLIDINSPPRLSLIVLIAIPGFIAPLQTIARSIYHCGVEIVDNVDDAYAITDPYNEIE